MIPSCSIFNYASSNTDSNVISMVFVAPAGAALLETNSQTLLLILGRTWMDPVHMHLSSIRIPTPTSSTWSSQVEFHPGQLTAWALLPMISPKQEPRLQAMPSKSVQKLVGHMSNLVHSQGCVNDELLKEQFSKEKQPEGC